MWLGWAEGLGELFCCFVFAIAAAVPVVCFSFGNKYTKLLESEAALSGQQGSSDAVFCVESFGCRKSVWVARILQNFEKMYLT